MANEDYKLLALYEVKSDKAVKNQEKFNDALEEGGKKAQSTAKNFNQIKDQLAGLGVGLAAAGAVFKKTFEFAEVGAQLEQTEMSYMSLMEQLGVGNDILERQQSAVAGTIDRYSLMESTQTLLAGTSKTLGSALAESTPNLLEIAKAANKLNPALGDTTFLYDSLATGIKRASPMILDNLGLTIKIGEANEMYAESIGKTVDELTAEEKQMALMNEVRRAGNRLVEQAGGNIDSNADTYARLRVKIKETADEMKVLLSNRLEPLIRGFLDFNDAMREHREGLFDNSDTYQEYRDELMRVHGVQGLISGNIEVLTENQFLEKKAIEEGVNAFMDMHNQMAENSTMTQQLTEDTWGLVVAEEEANQTLDNLSNLMSTDLTGAYEDIQEKKQDLIDKTGEIKSEIAKLEGSWKANTAEGKAELDDLYVELEEVEGQIQDVEKAWEKQTDRMIFDLARQQLAVDGFTNEELAALSQLAGPEGLGLVDEAYATLIENIGLAGDVLQEEGDQSAMYVDALRGVSDQLQDTTQDADGLTESLRRIPQSVTSTVTVNRFENTFRNITTNSPQFNPITPSGAYAFQDGGNFVVPPQFINDSLPIRVGAGEEVNVTSRQDMQRNEREGNQDNKSFDGMFAGANFIFEENADIDYFAATFREVLS